MATFDQSFRPILTACGMKAGIPPAEIKGTVSFDKGKVRNVVAHPNPEIGGTRLSFQLAQGSEKAVELRAQLFRGDDPVSEVWMDRWTP